MTPLISSALIGTSLIFSEKTYIGSSRVLLLILRGMKRKPPPPGKPPIVPPSKKDQKKWMDVEDVKELLWRRHAYNNAVVSLRRLYKEEMKAKEAEGTGIEALRKKEEKEFKILLKMNDKANKEAAKWAFLFDRSEFESSFDRVMIWDLFEFYQCYIRQREAREKEQAIELEKQILEHIEEELTEQAELAKTRVEEVLEMIKRSKDFVTRENLDEKLKEALENPVTYDFAVDLQGRKIFNPLPVKYLEGIPPRQTGRVYDVTLNRKEEVAK
ncbi:unnamed protein product [Enterobius vermicularis]|uniref:Small ribosomal subunit protein mS26 n=1 Tax=Enterobius vermicularis TaxID=51028 RepID=A0A0N4UYU1_ENTVE|nr:unnamed protein product [Enterobius vermicularis]